MPDRDKLSGYIRKLETELQLLTDKQSELSKKLNEAAVDTTSLATVRTQLQDFIRNIKAIITEMQWHMLSAISI